MSSWLLCASFLGRERRRKEANLVIPRKGPPQEDKQFEIPGFQWNRKLQCLQNDIPVCNCRLRKNSQGFKWYEFILNGRNILILKIDLTKNPDFGVVVQKHTQHQCGAERVTPLTFSRPWKNEACQIPLAATLIFFDMNGGPDLEKLVRKPSVSAQIPKLLTCYVTSRSIFFCISTLIPEGKIPRV